MKDAIPVIGLDGSIKFIAILIKYLAAANNNRFGAEQISVIRS